MKERYTPSKFGPASDIGETDKGLGEPAPGDNRILDHNSSALSLGDCSQGPPPHGGQIVQLRSSRPLDYDPDTQWLQSRHYRDIICGMCERTVALALNIPLSRMQARTRCNADVALARQIAMYLSHTTFSLLLTEVGLHFKRDRSTVSHACAMIEDRRDNPEFELMLCQLEGLLMEARRGMELGVEAPPQEGEGPVRNVCPQIERPVCGQTPHPVGLCPVSVKRTAEQR